MDSLVHFCRSAVVLYERNNKKCCDVRNHILNAHHHACTN